MQLIINADDFGLTQGVNDAILELADLGSISSTTVMVNMPHWEEVSELLQFPNFGIGLHLNLTEGVPLSPPSQIPSLVDEDGCFLGQKVFRERERRWEIHVEEMLAELTAQYSLLKEKIGFRLDHLDTHQNIHKAHGVAKALLNFGQQNPGLGLRAPYRYVLNQNKLIPGIQHSLRSLKLIRATRDLYLWNLTRKYKTVFSTPNAELHSASFRKLDLLNSIAMIPDSGNGCFEIACHPAKNISDLGISKLTEQRVEEYQLMANAAFRDSFGPCVLTSFRSIS